MAIVHMKLIQAPICHPPLHPLIRYCRETTHRPAQLRDSIRGKERSFAPIVSPTISEELKNFDGWLGRDYFFLD